MTPRDQADDEKRYGYLRLKSRSRQVIVTFRMRMLLGLATFAVFMGLFVTIAIRDGGDKILIAKTLAIIFVTGAIAMAGMMWVYEKWVWPIQKRLLGLNDETDSVAELTTDD